MFPMYKFVVFGSPVSLDPVLMSSNGRERGMISVLTAVSSKVIKQRYVVWSAGHTCNWTSSSCAGALVSLCLIPGHNDEDV